jgi:hypothetical protein
MAASGTSCRSSLSRCLRRVKHLSPRKLIFIGEFIRVGWLHWVPVGSNRIALPVALRDSIRKQRGSNLEWPSS